MFDEDVEARVESDAILLIAPSGSAVGAVEVEFRRRDLAMLEGGRGRRDWGVGVYIILVCTLWRWM